MSVFIVSRRTDCSRPVATRRCTTKGADLGRAWAGRRGATGPAAIVQASEVPRPVMAWPAAGWGVVATGGLGGGEDEQT
jgi:hypothetical protein